MFGISITPHGANLRMVRQQIDGGLDGIDKLASGGQIGFAQIKGGLLEIPLEQGALMDRRHRRPRERRAITCLIRPTSFFVHGVNEPVKPFSTSCCHRASRC